MSPTARGRAVRSPTSVPCRGISVRGYISLRSIMRLFLPVHTFAPTQAQVMRAEICLASIYLSQHKTLRFRPRFLVVRPRLELGFSPYQSDALTT